MESWSRNLLKIGLSCLSSLGFVEGFRLMFGQDSVLSCVEALHRESITADVAQAQAMSLQHALDRIFDEFFADELNLRPR